MVSNNENNSYSLLPPVNTIFGNVCRSGVVVLLCIYKMKYEKKYHIVRKVLTSNRKTVEKGKNRYLEQTEKSLS